MVYQDALHEGCQIKQLVLQLAAIHMTRYLLSMETTGDLLLTSDSSSQVCFLRGGFPVDQYISWQRALVCEVHRGMAKKVGGKKSATRNPAGCVWLCRDKWSQDFYFV